MKTVSKIAIVLGFVVLLSAAFVMWQRYEVAMPSIRIGVLHSLSGAMAASEKPLVNALQLAIEEVNAAGGIKGRKIEALIVDCRSDPAYCALQAERLISRENVQVLFGCWTSACRKALKPIVEKHQHLLFYPAQHEGMEQSANIVYTGATPNQQIFPAVRWMLEKFGKRVYLVSSDQIFPRVADILIKDLLAAHGAVVVGERYPSSGPDAMAELAVDIARQRPDMVLDTISGDDNIAFFRALNQAGVMPDKTPVMSFCITEVELAAEGAAPLAGHYAAWNYFQSIQSPQNRAFVQHFHARFGRQAPLDDPMEASYIGLQLWAQAAREAGSAEPAQVQRTILHQSLFAPEGVVSLDPATRHLWKVARIGKARSDGQFDIVWQSERPLEPSPFPTYRSREAWGELLQAIEQGKS